ncbi:hypothetical protein A3C20_00845 [Candidatus Kaiserbacteria bacterium RIFCSPHIGHO2_02_FULL_55_25]|uniref:Uncharacterized protein n=1 Tax=Candidatus Kaiserbacteria bacterium RIFCSPHIGHO2_02_FULL_55_25 TaxID=1798498 RepID=A0A1F6E6V2_9BACT|nr:MAG: hypothetical protein A2764_03885 [Candidatus Kaiserbacteria bacterium RIFCSPHIGHO2_01_FULL_55_79]OGG69435.1 MAG: hypothetical protein A3C20_00845 [Candidatus Kaiserbacteria bacterium RIFCSPHIGHO2_02_FULL_55_25]OGG83100.1 MAG: hypothetical protein A3A42_00555 [Candidatus Kaiserbacteria bacterium RIFCSPLOWO2_01_FULL_55_25]
MSTFDALVRDAASYLESHRRCSKHHVEHTGSNCYLLDFYSTLGEIEKGKRLIAHLFTLVTDTKGGKVFYPGHMNPMNMSQNVIDTGAAVDSIARFLHLHRNAFTQFEHTEYGAKLREIAETYLKSAAAEKTLTNQRLWGLTGLASYARYAGTHIYDDIVRASIERAFADTTPDGFFLYMPHAREHGNFEGYEGITTFYQSRCTAFIRYSLKAAGIDSAPYEERLRTSERALLAMYRSDGTKDLRLECKRWYWQSAYEVASAGFDAYALAHSKESAAGVALHNLLFQTRRHFFDGYLHSHIGLPVNFQCPIFWTAHLAWMLRVENIRSQFDAASSLKDFSFRFEGKEVFTDTTPSRRTLVNARWQQRNFNEGIYGNGLADAARWSWCVPALPPAFLFSVRETANHTWYALRGGHFSEAALRIWRFARELLVMLLPRYSTRYGKVSSFAVRNGTVNVTVISATKYGTIAVGEPVNLNIPL